MTFLSNDDATAEIRRLAQDSSNVIFTSHAYENMALRDIDQQEVIKWLKLGTVNDAPERKKVGDPYRYKTDIRNGGNLNSVVVEIEVGSDLLVITVFKK